MEARYQRREAELHSAIDKLRSALDRERREFARTVEAKNIEIEKFRRELDNLLDAMIEIQEEPQLQKSHHPREGVVAQKHTNCVC